MSYFARISAIPPNAKKKADRDKLILQLSKTQSKLAQEFEDTKHDAEAQSKFARESRRFILTAVGDVNTYPLFSDLSRQSISPTGRAGIIVPTGIAINDTTKEFFADLIQRQSLISLLGFTNWAFIFPAVGHRSSFCLLTLGGNKIATPEPLFVYHCHYVRDLNQPERFFRLTPKAIELINPETLTCPIFRTGQDADLTQKIYSNCPIFINDKTGENPWLASFMRMFDMSNDSHLFENIPTGKSLPLYEAKMFFIYDHRYGSYNEEMLQGDQVNFKIIPTPSVDQLQNPHFAVTPRHYVSEDEVNHRLDGQWDKKWLLCFRGITLSVNERTAIFTILSKVGVGNSAPVVLANIRKVKLISCLLANCCTLIFDFVARQKVGGNNMNFFILKQLPVIPPATYTPEDIEFISDRVLELTYTAWDLQPFAKDMEYDGPPFIWDSDRRALLRAELDAHYAKLYGLTREELRYILDPADIYGPDFPSETFRVLKNNEIKQFGEYRTKRLVLEAWDRMGL